MSEINKFPITQYLESICGELKKAPGRCIVLTAETGAGKSTVFPLGLLQHFEGKILMTEPRRLAVLGVANRVSGLLGEECGQTAGYKIHLENKCSEKTRLTVVTEAILVRMLQEDPALEDYKVVVLDEFHERGVNLDLALAFLKEAMELREDLFVVVMSATIDAEKISAYLGNGNEGSVPVVKIPGRLYEVTVEYKGNEDVEKAVFEELSRTSGDILVFLPGIYEIKKLYGRLKDDNIQAYDAEPFILHSSISIGEQRKILVKKEGEKRRVILSSAIAETSLTVPDITCVIDSGLCRINRMNVALGMEALVTEYESEFSAEQRKGRAGRLQNGRCIRLWNKGEARVKNIPPEILRCDLSSVVLECAERGVYDLNTLDWLENPGIAAWNESKKLLVKLGFIGPDGHITKDGKAALGLGCGIRLGAILIGAKKINTERAKEKALEYAVRFGSYSQSSPEVKERFKADLRSRMERLTTAVDKYNYSEKLLLLYGFPDRIGKKVLDGKDKSEYQFESGRKAFLASEGKVLPEWISAPVVLAGESEGRIFEYEELKGPEFEEFLNKGSSKEIICSFDEGKVRKTEVMFFGKIKLWEKHLPSSREDGVSAWLYELETKGIQALPLNEKCQKFLVRCKFYAQQKKDDTEFCSMIESLGENGREWLLPFITENEVNGEIIYNALFWYLNGDEINKKVPEVLVLENGVKAKVSYEKLADPVNKTNSVLRPSINIVIQRVFACTRTPEILGMKVLLRLLSPAQRPLQITDDLENFWMEAWPEICKEMKGRYPKHNWNYKIFEEN